MVTACQLPVKSVITVPPGSTGPGGGVLLRDDRGVGALRAGTARGRRTSAIKPESLRAGPWPGRRSRRCSPASDDDRRARSRPRRRPACRSAPRRRPPGTGRSIRSVGARPRSFSGSASPRLSFAASQRGRGLVERQPVEGRGPSTVFGRHGDGRVSPCRPASTCVGQVPDPVPRTRSAGDSAASAADPHVREVRGPQPSSFCRASSVVEPISVGHRDELAAVVVGEDRDQQVAAAGEQRQDEDPDQDASHTFREPPGSSCWGGSTDVGCGRAMTCVASPRARQQRRRLHS